jgi:hypothetical protein
VHASISRVGNCRAPGPDGIPYELYKLLPLFFEEKLCYLTNKILQGKTELHDFAAGNIILIHKQGDDEDLANYRPIILLNTDYKIFAYLNNEGNHSTG